VDYSTVIEAIIKQTQEALGDVAINQANSVEGLDVDEDGSVGSDAGKEDLGRLLDQYRSFMKGGADANARMAVRELYEHDRSVTDLDLPDSILPREVRADQFASAL